MAAWKRPRWSPPEPAVPRRSEASDAPPGSPSAEVSDGRDPVGGGSDSVDAAEEDVTAAAAAAAAEPEEDPFLPPAPPLLLERLFLRQPPPTGTLRSVPPRVQ
jgi:hypothetical protein